MWYAGLWTLVWSLVGSLLILAGMTTAGFAVIIGLAKSNSDRQGNLHTVMLQQFVVGDSPITVPQSEALVAGGAIPHSTE
mmetsp:Transcript_47096/g.86368  ORF Transcript_47096/g.86368 Transcript_47096/m.86368 type:complete len:80 (+) Transcript_47096:1696-1935(+)